MEMFDDSRDIAALPKAVESDRGIALIYGTERIIIGHNIKSLEMEVKRR